MGPSESLESTSVVEPQASLGAPPSPQTPVQLQLALWIYVYIYIYMFLFETKSVQVSGVQLVLGPPGTGSGPLGPVAGSGALGAAGVRLLEAS